MSATKHHRVASGPEADQGCAIQLGFLDPTKRHAKTGANETSSTTSLLTEQNIAVGTKRLWAPFFLRRTALLAFTVCFIVLLVALTTIWRISEKEQGLSTVNPSNYYLWTYGPTAVFTIVSALWGQVQYRALQLFPWRLMSRGFVSASDSVLLDYLSMWNVSALFKSLKRGHYMVSIPIAVSLVIKLMTVLSTGLFLAKDIQLVLTKDFQIQKDFQGSSFNESAVDSRVYVQAWGVAQHNLSHPQGTMDKHAFQNFFYDTSPTGTPMYLENTTYQAVVDVFTPSLECHETSVTTYAHVSDVKLQIDDCTMVIDDYSINQFPLTRTALGSCDGTLSGVGDFNDYESMDVKNIDWRFWIYIADSMREEPNGHPVPYAGYPNDTAYVDIIGLMCELSYSTDRGNVTLMGSGDTGNPSVDLKLAHPVEIPELADVSASSILYGSYLSVAKFASSITARSTPYLLLNTGGRGLEDVFDVKNLTDQVTEMFHALAVHLTSDYLMVPRPRSESSTEPGTMRIQETRLTVRDESVYAIVSILGLLAVVSLLFCIFFLPSAVCSRDPGSISGLGTILANSHEFMDALSGKGHASKADLRKVVSSQVYATTAKGDVFSIKQDGPEIEKSGQSSQLSWWRPFAAAPLVRALILLAPIGLIIILEILYQKSRSSNGFANIDTSSRYLSYTWTYIPPLVMLGVRSLYECVYFSARVFQPYHELKRGHAPPETGIMDNQHRSIAIVGVWEALTKRQWSVMAAGIAVLIGPFLPIVTSGLYTVSDVMTTSNIALTQMNRVNMSEGYFYQKTSDYEDVKLGDMIIQYDLSYPQWTYQDLSLPKLQVNQTSLPNETASALNGRGYSVKAQVPGLRLNLGCEELPPEEYTAGPDPGTDDEVHIGANVTALIEDCGFEAHHLRTAGISSGNVYFNALDQSRADDLYELPSSCPGLVVMYGKVGSTPGTLAAITLLKCRPKVEQVDVLIQLSLPSYTLDLSSPPSVVPGSVTTLFDGYMGSPGELAAPDGDEISSAILYIYPGDSSTEGLDPVFRSIIYGEANIPASDLLDADILAPQLQRVWSIITAQMINSIGREDYKDPAAATASTQTRPVYKASLQNPSGARHFQNMISTRVLQAVLAAMTLCGTISIFLMDTREILPKNPLSIAAAASLLADSHILGSGRTADHERSTGMIPPGSEWCNDRQLKERGVFQGRTFTLGWWETERSDDDNNINDSLQDSAVSNDEDGSVRRHSSSFQPDSADETGRRFGIDADDTNHCGGAV
ncbi:hypothetical protein ASPVEDRAFT_126945 [Aspergillus versicolor CBS 583.65]|uniref:Uncharacterized protein n=1 Tax=Aspergillus versicolor CBS 583.65 TaxID=1036611 RepID=A0A1L9PE98_ASPVE|nr:uncharacterized protein ASPVEDRAFT_126945 [Aspergillus versicolor CBS 583.65]OJI99829.1 hypothetical protein ASPVEDRAFT_126945 [Aspergillus versicolor CBS 583.65]